MPEAATQAPAAPPAPGTPEYDAAMVAKFEQATGTKPEAPKDAPPAPTKPEGVPDKFWNAEKGVVDYAAWSKSTAELEARFTKERQQPPATPPAPPKDEAKAALEAKVASLKADTNTKPEDLAAAEKALADYVPPTPKVDMKAFTDELIQNGTLSEESYAALEKVGYDREFVDQYIEGRKAIAAQREAAGHQLAGGKEQFTAMTQWAASNLSHEEKVAFNKAVTGTDAEMRMAIEGLKARYTQANGSDPKLLGGSPPPTGDTGFKSRAEMTAAMRDPRYAKDPAYRASVERKVAASTAF